MREYPAARRPLVSMISAVMFVLMIYACASGRQTMDSDRVKELAKKYTAAWCSQNAASVASFYSESGSLKINDGAPAVGRTAITAAAQSFMTAFPDMIVALDSLTIQGNHAVYRWTLAGTNTGPGGTGKAVRISGYEEWTLSADGLIQVSLGHFDEADYQRQLKTGVATAVGEDA